MPASILLPLVLGLLAGPPSGRLVKREGTAVVVPSEPAPTPPPGSTTPAPDPGHEAFFRGVALMHAGKYREAREELIFASGRLPDAAPVWKALGRTCYLLNRNDDAVRSLREAVRLAPADFESTALLERLVREDDALGSAHEAGTPRVSVLWDGRRADPAFGAALVRALDEEARGLERRLGFAPDEPTAVIVSTEREFRSATGTPAFVEAAYDGKVRLPVLGMHDVTPDLRRVARHELTHAFVHVRARGRAPRWLHEGLAELMEDGDAGNRPLPAVPRGPFLRALAGDWLAGGAASAAYAYDLARAAVATLVAGNGLDRIDGLLRRLGDGESVDAALAGCCRTSLDGLSEETAARAAKAAAAR